MNTFPRKLRLTSNAQFKYVFDKNKIKIISKPFTLYHCANSLTFPRLGVVVPKKQIAQAVRRNYFKRLVRDMFRHQQHLLPAIDMVVLVSNTAKHYSGCENRQRLQYGLDKMLPAKKAIYNDIHAKDNN